MASEYSSPRLFSGRLRAVVDVDRARDAVDREVRVHGAHHQGALRLAGVDLDAEVVARAEDVVLLDRGRQRQLLGVRVAGAEQQVAGGLFLDLHGQVDLVGSARHLGGVDADLLEVAQPVDTVARQLDAAAVVPRRLELAELAPHDFVARARVAGHVDAAHVDAALRLGEEAHDHLAGGAVDLGPLLDPREGVAVEPEQVGDALGGLGHGLAAVGRARPHQHARAELVVLAEVVAFQAHGGDGVGLALTHRDRDRDLLLVGRDRDLRRLDRELEIAAVHVEGAQCLQVGIELGARVAVALAVPGEPAHLGELEQVQQCRSRKASAPTMRMSLMRAASPSVIVKVTLTRLRSIGVTVVTTSAPYRLRLRYWRLISCSARSISALSNGRPFADAGVLQRLGQRLLVEFLQADEVDRGDDGAFVDDHDGRRALDLDAHVLEQAGGEQRAQRGRALLVVVGVADAERQRAEHGAGVGALQAFDADVLQHEGRQPRRPRATRTAAATTIRPPAGASQRSERQGTWRTQCRPSKRATSLKRATDIIISSSAIPPRCSRASHRSDTGRPVTASKM